MEPAGQSCAGQRRHAIRERSARRGYAVLSDTNPMIPIHYRVKTFIACILWFCSTDFMARADEPAFKVVAFYTGKNDLAHISFVHEANRWFPQIAKQYHFTYDATDNWTNLNAGFLSQYQVVIFLDTRPEAPEQRAAFQQYMEHGGGWMGFHFSAFALTPSEYPQNWD